MFTDDFFLVSGIGCESLWEEIDRAVVGDFEKVDFFVFN